MKEIFRIEDTLTNKIIYYYIIAFMVCLPFDRFYSELVLISFLVQVLIHFKKEKLSHPRFPVLLPALLYLVTIAGAFYSSEKGQMFSELEKQLGLVLLPVIFWLISLDLKKYRVRLLKAFAISILVTVVYLYINAFAVIIYNRLPISVFMTTTFMNHNFSLPLELHATYFSMYVTVAAAIFLQLFIDSGKLSSRLLYITALVILMMAIFQLSSKAVFIATLILINIAIPFLVQTNRSRWKFVIVSATLSLAAIVGLSKSEAFQERYIVGLKEDLTQASYNLNVLEPRIVRWRSAWPIVKQSPIIGHGSGSEFSLLKEAYFEEKLYNSYLHGLNAHNQYISFLIQTGILGLAVFLFVLAVGFRQAITTKDFIFCSFMIVVTVVSMSENILDVNKGIFFFGFFYPFFMKSGSSGFDL